ncbi:AraC family transcriptional regulator [Paenibacillus lignilyticus]|uniref:Helix-turn-helix transcriptional regulator n=1 Tax=Paenibacillus lignilyticus TaxID=1172615 RepID=A0ABS5CMP3_9BACL|nr:AraC family transcriptional regulator [Paenibacillus lignilyticus]MBP3967131.1 helix-turn-helix transcriptional regulator [Paenibacillus lignilyticus]
MSQSLFVEPFLPFVRGVINFDLKRGETFSYPLHHHPDIAQLLLITEGSGSFLIDGKIYKAGPRTMLVYDTGVWHEELSDASEPFKAISISFNAFQLTDLAPGTFIKPGASPVIELGDRYEEALSLSRIILRLAEDPYVPAGLSIRYYVAILLIELAKLVHNGFIKETSTSTDRTVAAIKQYIHNHYMDAITLDQLSKASFFSPGYTCRVFSQSEGISPIQYLVGYRMEVAKHYLRTEREPVYRIAELVGYQSETHFKNVFKKTIGLPPHKYRKMHRLEG